MFKKAKKAYKKNFLTKTIVSLFLLTFVLSSFSLNLPTAYGTGKGNCETGFETKIEPGPFTYTSESIINKVIVKAGSAQSTDDDQCTSFTQDGNNDCYAVTGLGTNTVTVTKIGSGPDCKDISHVEFYTNQNPTPRPSASPSVSPSTSPSTTPVPSTNPRPSPSTSTSPRPSITPKPSPSTTPEPSASPSPQAPNVQITVDGPDCYSLNFKVHVHAEENGTPANDHDVEFKYNNEIKKTKTDVNGNASVEYTYMNNVDITYAIVSPWGEVSHGVTRPNYDSCTYPSPSAGVGGTDVLGTSTEGQVLGASTLASTGSITSEFMYTIFAAGLVMTTTGAFVHAKATRKAKKA